MAKRNFSMVDYFDKIAKDWQPLLRYESSTQEDFKDWQARDSEKYF